MAIPKMTPKEKNESLGVDYDPGSPPKAPKLTPAVPPVGQFEEGPCFLHTGGIEQKKNAKTAVLGESSMCLCKSHEEQILPGDWFDLDDLIRRGQMTIVERSTFLKSTEMFKTIFPVNQKAKDLMQHEVDRKKKPRLLRIND